MISAVDVERETYYATVGYVGKIGDFSWSILEFPAGCSVTIHVHKKEFKKKIATRAKWVNVPQIIADYINKQQKEMN